MVWHEKGVFYNKLIRSIEENRHKTTKEDGI